MKEIGEGKKQLFRYHIEQNIAKRNSGSVFQLRTNRWRFSTYDKPKMFRQLKLGGPILFSLVMIALFGKLQVIKNVMLL
jgi:ABC-type transporter Mla maintaining outer membrane lipid asymmetry ATPase subunit MlaF